MPTRPPRKVRDATVVDPEGHRVAFENDQVRVVEILLPTGRVVGWHSHLPRVSIVLTSCRFRLYQPDGSTRIVDYRPGETFWSGVTLHQAEVLVGPAHAVEVEVKSARPKATARASARPSRR